MKKPALWGTVGALCLTKLERALTDPKVEVAVSSREQGYRGKRGKTE
jgi:hypothetical protein